MITDAPNRKGVNTNIALTTHLLSSVLDEKFRAASDPQDSSGGKGRAPVKLGRQNTFPFSIKDGTPIYCWNKTRRIFVCLKDQLKLCINIYSKIQTRVEQTSARSPSNGKSLNKVSQSMALGCFIHLHRIQINILQSVHMQDFIFEIYICI